MVGPNKWPVKYQNTIGVVYIWLTLSLAIWPPLQIDEHLVWWIGQGLS